MPARNRKGRFTKGGHHKARTRTVTKYKTRYRTRHARKHSRRRRHHSGGGISIGKLAIAGLGLAYLTGPKAPIAAVTENIAKVPGAKTFGNTAVAGAICLGIDRFVKRNAWLRAAGLVGVVLGATQLGSQGADFKWLGDGSDGFVGDIDDVAGDDDVSGDEFVGDED